MLKDDWTTLYCSCTIFPDGHVGRWEIHRRKRRRRRGGGFGGGGEEGWNCPSKEKLQTQVERVNLVAMCDSYSILSLLVLTKKVSTCRPHTHAGTHSHNHTYTHTQPSSILSCSFWKTNPTKQIRRKFSWFTQNKHANVSDVSIIIINYLCQLFSFVVQWVHNFAHVLNGFKSCLVCLVNGRLFKDDQDSFPLVQDPCYNKSMWEIVCLMLMLRSPLIFGHFKSSGSFALKMLD